MTVMKPVTAGFLFLALCAALSVIYYGTRIQEYKSDQFLMDTIVSIKVYGKDSGKLREAVTEAFAEMRRIAELSDHFPQPGTTAFDMSDVCRINSNAGIRPVSVNKDVMEMLTLSKKYHAASEGAFDITIGPVMELWRFDRNNTTIPLKTSINSRLALVNCQDLFLDVTKQTAFLQKSGMKLDLGAVAKGYATEAALQVLKRHGIRKALIDAGGNIRVLGTNIREAPWRIGIKDPRNLNGLVAVLSLVDTSAVTSGDYFRYFESEGKRWHHILNPRTGYPANESMSVTVITKNAGLADILSTVFFVLSPDKALALADQMDGVDLFIVTSDGRIMHTSRLGSRIEITNSKDYRYDQGR